jgi:hypothetical protein
MSTAQLLMSFVTDRPYRRPNVNCRFPEMGKVVATTSPASGRDMDKRDRCCSVDSVVKDTESAEESGLSPRVKSTTEDAEHYLRSHDYHSRHRRQGASLSMMLANLCVNPVRLADSGYLTALTEDVTTIGPRLKSPPPLGSSITSSTRPA